MPRPYGATALPVAPPPLDESLVRSLRAAGLRVELDPAERAEHGRDWWPLSLLEVREGRPPSWPAAVVYASSTDDVASALRLANDAAVPVTAQGGRSGVEGGAQVAAGGIALDLTGLNRVTGHDPVAGTVDVEAGVFGPDLERAVAAWGFTVGHFPQSFDLSTVGGWLACRGAGQLSNRYGTAADLVRGATVVLAAGEVIRLGGRGPQSAVGPDLLQLFVGSEGTLGVITQATLLMRPRPVAQWRAAFALDDVDEGLDRCRRIVQRGATPAVLRLYDPTESERHFSVTRSVLIVLDEGDPSIVDGTRLVVEDVLERDTPLDPELVTRWLEHRNDVSALAPLWDAGIIVDTIEVDGPWSALPTIRRDVTSAVTGLEGTLLVSAHQSHAYPDGACLYFTFAGRPSGDPVAYYRRAWDAATRATLAAGGALTHHHGVGRNRARFVADALGASYDVLSSIKAVLDPRGILNPGVLGLGGEPW